jgi:anti-sigma factor RsiW
MLTLTSSRRALQTAQIARHLTHCPECLALRSHIFGLLLPGSAEPAADCDACQDDLAAYVDLSLDDGARAAAEAYPHLWWHLWGCASCAEVFAQTAALAGAERRGALPPLPIARQAAAGPRVIGRLAVAPQAIARLFQVRGALGSAYGGADDLVLDEGEAGGYGFQLSVHSEPGGTWAILVTVIPPVEGQAVVQVGAHTFTASFDGQGIAQVTGIDASLFRDGQPAISVAIEAI